jgi:hypothetical protein
VGTDEVMPIFVRQAFGSFELLVMPPETEQQSKLQSQQNNALQPPVLFLSITQDREKSGQLKTSFI